jgi:hypothetical protein
LTAPSLAEVVPFLTGLASIATAVGVVFAGWQLRATKDIARTQFEDRLTEQYRNIIRQVPIEALLGAQLSDEEHVKALPIFYHYFDLSNEQAFLNDRERIRDRTWKEWRDGIEQNLSRPAFARAWREIEQLRPDSFAELRSVLAESPLLRGQVTVGLAEGVAVGVRRETRESPMDRPM